MACKDTTTAGALVVIGGSEDKDGACTILKEFIRLAGGKDARIVVMTVATRYPDEAGEIYTKVFRRLGVRDVSVVHVVRRADANAYGTLKTLLAATGIFFTGGNQLHITSLLGGTGMHNAVRQLHQRGVIIAGTSAGASMMSDTMILRGDPNSAPRYGRVETCPAMNFLIGTIVDVHFSERGRHGRLFTAVAHYPQDIGIGIDEDTALIVRGRVGTVIGSGAVTIIDAGTISYTNLPLLERNQNLSLFDVTIHVLSAGCRYDLDRRIPLAEEDQIPTALSTNHLPKHAKQQPARKKQKAK